MEQGKMKNISKLVCTALMGLMSSAAYAANNITELAALGENGNVGYSINTPKKVSWGSIAISDASYRVLISNNIAMADQKSSSKTTNMGFGINASGQITGWWRF